MEMIGRTVTPGLRISRSRKVIPAWRLGSSEVRVRQNIQSALCAPLVHTFSPSTT